MLRTGNVEYRLHSSKRKYESANLGKQWVMRQREEKRTP
jgi:hypothetical protein